MATEECFRELSPTLAIHNGDTNFKSAALEAGTLLVRPWTTIPVTLSEDMDKDSEVRSLLKDDHQTKCSYPDHLNANKPDFQSQHRFSLTLSSTSSCNDNNDTFSKFPNKRPEDLSSNYSSSKTVQRKQRICSWFYGWGNGLLTALLLFGCAFLLTFLLGLLIGYYVKVGGKLDSSQEQSSVDASNGDNTKDDDWTSTENCYQTKQFLRRCKPDPRLDSIHGNIMYYVNGDRMTDYISKFPSHSAWQTEQEWDTEMTEHLHQEFALYGLDKVEVFTYNVVASSPNPDSPRQLELTDSHGQVKLNVALKSLFTDERENGSNKFHNIYSQSVDNFFKASLFFANYGTSADFNHLKNLEANLTDQMVLLRTGKLSIEEKLLKAHQEGVRGVLFYSDFEGNADDHWKNENHNTSEPYFISSFTEGHLPGTLDSFPNVKQLPYVYNISSSLALQILSILGEPKLSRNGSDHLNTSKHYSGDPINITLKFASHLKTVTVSNVVGTLYGINQPDEQVFVGSRRLYGANDQINHTSVGQSGTAMLLELLHSLLHVRDIEGWQPQRTIKFFSWGTATGNDNAGVQEYLKKNSWIVNSRNVGYVELQDVIGKWCNHLFIRADSVSLETVVRATEMVPDPTNPESSISVRYKYKKSERPMSSTSDAAPGSLTFQLADVHTLQMSQWVPTTQFSCVYSTTNEQGKLNEQQPLSDRNHHYRHHMAVTRVASLVLLALADKERHGYSVEQLISAVQHEVSRFLTRCHGVSFKSVDKAMSALLQTVVKVQHPATLKIWQGRTHLASTDWHWHIHNCRNQLLLLHRILAPLTRLNSFTMSLELLQLEPFSSSPRTHTPLVCLPPVLTAITQRLEQAFYSLSD